MDRNNSRLLLYAPNFVYGPTFELKKELKDTYTYPTSFGYSGVTVRAILTQA